MKDFNQIESDILSKISKVQDRNSYESAKTEIFGKKGIITELFKKIGESSRNKNKGSSQILKTTNSSGFKVLQISFTLKSLFL